MVHAVTGPARRALKLMLPLIVALGVLVPASTAHAEWHFTKSGAQRIAKDYVSRHYADTYVENLTTFCRPQGRRYNPRYKYHRWVCGWYDAGDKTSGAVLIIGSDITGSYYGRVLTGAHRAG
jgi:hypothetical protein